MHFPLPLPRLWSSRAPPRHQRPRRPRPTRRVINGGTNYEALWAIDLITGPFVTNAVLSSARKESCERAKTDRNEGRAHAPQKFLDQITKLKTLANEEKPDLMLGRPIMVGHCLPDDDLASPKSRVAENLSQRADNSINRRLTRQWHRFGQNLRPQRAPRIIFQAERDRLRPLKTRCRTVGQTTNRLFLAR